MCAIIGAVGKKLPAREIFERARDTMAHRGPDGMGIYYEPKEGIALGHRRLAIIDLSNAGNQPMISNDGRYQIVFNGEIYNYLELKRELKGYQFKTKTDTEVLLAAYERWGTNCLDRLEGMFSFAIWDSREKSLFAARDRFGEKPFFYSVLGADTFVFASEIKGLLALGVKPKINESAIHAYLVYGYYDHSNETFFDGVQVLPPGHMISRGQDGDLDITRYWDIADARPIIPTSPEGILERYKELLEKSVELRFRSDVPVGLNLSSGLDSNSLRYFSECTMGKTVDMFSLCLPSDEYNECDLIEKFLTEDEKKRWHTTVMTPENVWSDIERMVKIEDQPFGGVPTIAYLALPELAKRSSVTVLLEGQGLDELLGGYPYYLSLVEAGNMPALPGKSQDMSQETDGSVLEQAFVGQYAGGAFRFPEPFSSPLMNAQYRDIGYTKLPRVLRFNDHASMALGRELRMPYLSREFAEFCFHLPLAEKILSGEQKVLNRRAMKEYLPSVVRAKQKKVFGAIQTEWFRKYYKDATLGVLASSSFRSRPYWNHVVLEEKVQRFFSGEGTNSFFIWQCINLEFWLREFID